MPIKIQGDLPVKEILEKEIELNSCSSGHSSDSDPDSESDAAERRDGTSASAFAVKYTTAGGCDFYGG